mmetsp:Transcript_73385/g.190570  ORF Transcript_73385/g.190570 Transcript_73385/m.190570 type:complete len:234 (-) Transcript_73385:316-1017(-)
MNPCSTKTPNKCVRISATVSSVCMSRSLVWHQVLAVELFLPPSCSQLLNSDTKSRWSLSNAPSMNRLANSTRRLSFWSFLSPTPALNGLFVDSAAASKQTSLGMPKRLPRTNSLPMPASTGSVARCAPSGVSFNLAFSKRSCSSRSQVPPSAGSFPSSAALRCNISTAFNSTNCCREDLTAASVGGVRAFAKKRAGWPKFRSEIRRQSESSGTRSISGFSNSSNRRHFRTLSK